MPNNVEKMSFNYSPNFNPIKRNKKKIKYLIFHYTGMKNDRLAINKLISHNSKVSCHQIQVMIMAILTSIKNRLNV